jgi:septal ring factor EnvC (AmiA/AmiB activator)
MSEPTAEATTETVAPVEAPAQETDWKAEARKWEDRAKQNKTAAEKLAELEEANKTAEQKANERLEAAERRAAELESKAAKAEVAGAAGVPADLLDGPASSSPDDLRAYAEKLIAFKGVPAEPVTGPYVPAEGRRPQALALNGDGLEDALRNALKIN